MFESCENTAVSAANLTKSLTSWARPAYMIVWRKCTQCQEPTISCFSRMKEQTIMTMPLEAQIKSKTKALLWHKYWQNNHAKLQIENICTFSLFLGQDASLLLVPFKGKTTTQDAHFQEHCLWQATNTPAFTFNLACVLTGSHLCCKYFFKITVSGLH